MPDLTPPPHEPMDDDTRARIAARLTDATGSPATGVRATRWLVPVGAAAAVLLIASVAGWAAFSPDDASAPSGPATSAVPSEPPTEAPSPTETEVSLSPSEPATSQKPGRRRPVRPLRPARAGKCGAGRDARDAGRGGRDLGLRRQVAALREQRGHRHRPPGPAGGTTRGARDRAARVQLVDLRIHPRPHAGVVRRGRSVARRRHRPALHLPGPEVQAAAITTDDEGRRWWILGYVPERVRSPPTRGRTGWSPWIRGCGPCRWGAGRGRRRGHAEWGPRRLHARQPRLLDVLLAHPRPQPVRDFFDGHFVRSCGQRLRPDETRAGAGQAPFHVAMPEVDGRVRVGHRPPARPEREPERPDADERLGLTGCVPFRRSRPCRKRTLMPMRRARTRSVFGLPKHIDANTAKRPRGPPGQAGSRC